jgi:aspartate/methionine/tyrosine aminotransferase
VDNITQDIALSALTGPKDFVESMVNEFKRRRDFIHKRLDEIGLTCMLPKGAFYMFPNIKKFGMSSEAFARFPLKKAHVMIMLGSGYGRNGEGYVRISFAASYHRLEEALDRIEKALRKFR